MNIFRMRSTVLLSSLLICSAAAHADLTLADDAASAWAPSVFNASLELAAQSGASYTAAVSTPSVAADRSTILSAAAGEVSPALADIGLWRFISSIRAQQTGTALVLLESNLRILEISNGPATTTVPLPGAAWFLVMGLLGLVGVKITGSKAGYAESASGLRGSIPMPA